MWKTKISSGIGYLFISDCSSPAGDPGVGMTTDEKDGTTEWVFQMIESNRFQIRNAVGLNGATHLFANSDYCSVTTSRNPEHSEWQLVKTSAGVYHIQSVSGGYLGYVGVNPGYMKLYDSFTEPNVPLSYNLVVAVVSVDFDLEKGIILGSTPQTLTRQTLPNTSNTEQSMTFKVVEKVGETSTFESSAGVSDTIGTEFSTRLPCVSEGKVSAELTATFFEATWGKTQTFSTEIKTSYPIIAPAHTTVTCDVVVTKSKLTVPYTFTLADGTTENGTWTGASAWNVKAKYKTVEEESKEKEN